MSRSFNASFHPLLTFPEKLFLVANDNYVIAWTKDGDGVIVNPPLFEDEVMSCYPGFVQISSFLNLRRLFREYGFHWEATSNEMFIFSHRCFQRHRPELIAEVKTKRKVYNYTSKCDGRRKRYDMMSFFLKLANGEDTDIDEHTHVNKQHLKSTLSIRQERNQSQVDNMLQEVNDKDSEYSYKNHSPAVFSYIHDSLRHNEFVKIATDDFGCDGKESRTNSITLSDIPDMCCLKAGCFTIETKATSLSGIQSHVSVKPPEWPCPCIQAYLDNISSMPEFSIRETSYNEAIADA